MAASSSSQSTGGGQDAASSWSDLPKKVRFAFSAAGDPPPDHVLASLFSTADDLNLLIETWGFTMGSPEWLLVHDILSKYQQDANAGAARTWKRRALAGVAFHGTLEKPCSEKLPSLAPTKEWLLEKSGAKRRLLRWPNRRSKKLALATTDLTRAKAEADELTRWRMRLVKVLKDCRMPVCNQALFAADPDRVLQSTAGCVRASTLRSRIREWCKFSLWCLALHDEHFPAHMGVLVDYIEELRDEPCSRTRLRSVLSAVAFIEKAGGIDKADHFSNHHLVLNLVNVRTAELEVDAPAVRRAVPCPLLLVIAWELAVCDEDFPKYMRAFAWTRLFKFWSSSRSGDLEGASFDDMIMTAEGLRGFFDRTKTSGAGKKNRFLPFFIAADAWLARKNWLAVGFAIWKGPEFGFERDYMIPRPTRHFNACKAVMASYSDVCSLAKRLLRLLRKPVLRSDDWVSSEEFLISSDSLLRVFSEHSERASMATLATWAGVDRERKEYLGRWKIVESSDVYVRSAWFVVTTLQRFLVRSCTSMKELLSLGIGEIQERLKSFGLEDALALAGAEQLQMPREWALWRGRAFLGQQPIDLQRLSTPEVLQERGPERESRFFISVLGKRKLRRLHRSGACCTRPERVACCEFYDVLEGVPYDVECKHCFRPERREQEALQEEESDADEDSSSSSSSEKESSSEGS